MPDVRRNNQAASRHFFPNNRGLQSFAPRDKLHLIRDYALSGIMHLRADGVRRPFFNPLAAHLSLSVALALSCPPEAILVSCGGQDRARKSTRLNSSHI